MLNKYFNQELKHLREIAAEFAKENPAIAPMLGEPSADPDVERLLEGVAFLTATIQQKIDDEIPEIIHDVLRQTWPQYLRPIPACTLISVLPGEKLNQSTTVPSKTNVDSVPVDGTVCRFRTCSDVDIHPLTIQDVTYLEPPGQNPRIRLTFLLTHSSVADFRPERLCLHLGGNYSDASNLYLRLCTGLKEILIQAHDDETFCRLYPFFLNPVGFASSEALIPWPSNAFDGYRLIQEYFLMPEKFLFVELTGWDQWGTRKQTNVFHVDLVLNHRWTGAVKPGINSFLLSIVPAINLFPHEAAPVTIDHTRTDYPVRPAGDAPGNYQVFSIDTVCGCKKGGQRDFEFDSFHSFSADKSSYVYHESVKKNPVKDAMDFSVSLAYPLDKGLPDIQILSFDILCTNGYLTENLSEGDIRIPSADSPESIEFKNIRKPTVASLPPLGSETLWRLNAMMTLNHLTLTRPENLQANLKLLLMEGHRDKQNARINERRIQGIKGLKSYPVDRVVKGSMYRGLEILMTVNQSHFASQGDVYLFGSVLDRFLAMYASINTFTRLVMKDTDSGETYTWTERLGNQPFI